MLVPDGLQDAVGRAHRARRQGGRDQHLQCGQQGPTFAISPLHSAVQGASVEAPRARG